MTFAFDIGGTLTRYPEELWTIMECLRLGGHRVVMLSATGDGTARDAKAGLANLPFNFSAFELVTVVEDYSGARKADYCKRNGVCMLIDDAPYNMDGLRRGCPKTARIQVVP